LRRAESNYAYVRTAWGVDPPNAVQTTFRAAIVAYWNPDTEGFNKYDSLRIDDLYNALEAVPLGTTSVKAFGMDELLKATRNLDDQDVAYLEDPQQAVMLRDKVDKHLKGAALAAFHKELDELSVGHGLAKLFA
jgi:hypothetical protein